MNQKDQSATNYLTIKQAFPAICVGDEKLSDSRDFDSEALSQHEEISEQIFRRDSDSTKIKDNKKCSGSIIIESQSKTCDTNQSTPSSDKNILEIVGQENSHENEIKRNEEANQEQVVLEIVEEERFNNDVLQADQIESPQLDSQPLSVIEERNQNNPQSEPQSSPAISDIVWEPEVRMHIWKFLGLPLTIILFSIGWLFLVGPNKDRYDYLFWIVHGYFFYLGFLLLFWSHKIFDEILLNTNVPSEIANVIASGTSLFLVYLNYLETLPRTLFASIPFPLLILGSLILSFVQRKKNLKENVVRSLYSIQILLITLKFDGIIDWEWAFTLPLFWIHLLVKSFYFSKFVISLFGQIRREYSQTNQAQNLGLHPKTIGLIWYILHYGLMMIVIPVLFAVSLIYATKPVKEFDISNISAYFGLVSGSITMIYTLVSKRNIIRFIILTKLIHSYLVEIAERNMQEQKPTITLKLENKEEYFVMISSTYFTPLYKIKSLEGQDDLEKIKSKLATLKLRKENKKAVKLEIHDHRKVNSFQNATKDQESCDLSKELKPHKKLAVSFDNLEEAEKLRTPTSAESPEIEKEENHLCYICCVNEPDAILIGCGHGGACYTCLTNAIKKKGNCVECRSDVEGIYKINPKPLFSNIYKGIEVSKLIREK